jgi:glycosyltransferase involved in cell wall biosynthesis
LQIWHEVLVCVLDDGDMKNQQAVLMIGNFLSSSGMNRTINEDLAEGLRKAGGNILTTSNKPGRISRLIDMLNTIFHYRKEYEIALVDVYSGKAFIWAEICCFMLKLLNKPYILNLHGGSLPAFADRWPNRMRRLLNSARVVAVPSAYLMDAMAQYSSNIRVLPNPIDLHKYNYRLRKEPQPQLVWLRSFHAIYNPAMALHCMAFLLENHTDAYLRMVGPDNKDGSYQSAKDLMVELELMESVTLPGGIPKSAVPMWLDQGDIFINTTNVDNTPISVLEAMACGMCVVSTEVGGIPYLIRNEHDGLLVPPNDSKAMAEAIHRILTEPGLAERLSENAHLKAAHFDWSVILPQWQQLFLEVGRN